MNSEIRCPRHADSLKRFEQILVEHLTQERRTQRSRRRELDGKFCSEDWLLPG